MNYMLNGAPTRCAFCGEPFPLVGDPPRQEAWHDGKGRYFCNEFCADSVEAEYVQPREKVLQ